MKNNKKLKRLKTFKVPIFNRWISVFIGQDKEDAEAYVINKDNFLHVVFKKDVDDGIIVHEVVHLVNEIFMIVGQKGDSDNDELQAYLTQYLFKKIKKILKQSRVKK